MNQRYASIVDVLNKSGVRYIIIGGFAVVAHGLERYTFDLDIAIDPTRENAAIVLESLRQAGVPGSTDLSESEFMCDVGVTLYLETGAVDIHTETAGLDFDKAYSRKESSVVDGVEVHVASVEDLILMKRAAGRPKDLQDLRFLLEHYE